MLLQSDVTQDVIFSISAGSLTEIPRAVFGIVLMVLKPLQLVFKVDHVKRLLVPQSSILILGQNINEVILFDPLNMFLHFGVIKLLGEGIVRGLLRLDVLVGVLVVGFTWLLPGGASLLVLADVGLPGVVVTFSLDEVAAAMEHCFFYRGRCHLVYYFIIMK